MTNFKTFGEAIRDYRRKSDKTISDITNYMGWTKPYLMELETGRSSPPKKELIKKLSEILNVDDYELFKLAIMTRDKVTLNIPHNSEKHGKIAALLYRAWDNMTDEQFNDIEKIITKE